MAGALFDFLSSCGNVKKGGQGINDEDASEIQLNAFEFRNYRTSLDGGQQRLVERFVNQWCAILVKGKTLKVNSFEETVSLDKDMLTLEYSGGYCPLKAISKMEMFSDTDGMMLDSPWGLDITFEGLVGDTNLIFNFEQERQRLTFAITLRVLRSRDPTLDPNNQMEVMGKDENEMDADADSFGRIANTQHYSTDQGIPVVFSVSDMKLYQKLQSSSRHVYLEFFVRYPRQDRFLYAKSPTTHIAAEVLATEGGGIRRKKEKKDEADEEEEKKREDTKRQVLGSDIPIRAMKFDLKNVKLKVPKVPHFIFGRLMAKDDYFPTAVGTFDFEFKKGFLCDRRDGNQAFEVEGQKGRQSAAAGSDGRKTMKEDGKRNEPETLQIPVMSSWKVPNADGKGESTIKIGLLTIRIIGYIHAKSNGAGKPDAKGGGAGKAKGGDDSEQESEEEEEEEESDDD